MLVLSLLDREHLDNGPFLKSLALSLTRIRDVRFLFIHSDSEYTDRVMQTGMMRNEAKIRSTRELNHRLVALFNNEGVHCVGLNGYQKNCIVQSGTHPAPEPAHAPDHSPGTGTGRGTGTGTGTGIGTGTGTGTGSGSDSDPDPDPEHNHDFDIELDINAAYLGQLLTHTHVILSNLVALPVPDGKTFADPALLAKSLTNVLKPSNFIVFSKTETAGPVFGDQYVDSTDRNEYLKSQIPVEMAGYEKEMLISNLMQFSALPDISAMAKVRLKAE